MEALRLAAVLVTLALSPPGAEAVTPGVGAYEGSGAWIDRYDFARLPEPEAVIEEMAGHGVKTVYIETASWRVPRRVDIVDPDATAALIGAAHAHGMKAVAWYLPGFKNLRLDLRRVRAALEFETVTGERFDSFALDIEANEVNPVWKRNIALMKLSVAIREEAGPDYALGAIIPDQLSTSSGPVLWPSFPYADLAKVYDVFLPMAYSTFGRAKGRRGVYAYTARNVRFVRRATGRRVHLIGGLTDRMRPGEERAVARAARDAGAYGVSLYKYPLFDAGSWDALAAFAAR
jgi:hypothetical protein